MIRVDFENRRRIAEAANGEPYKCFQCGTCTVNCVLGDVIPVRREIRYIQLGVVPSDGGIWRCVTCNFCRSQCPSDVDIAAIFRGLRRINYDEKRSPEELNEVLWRVYEEGNPLGSPRGERFAWLNRLVANPNPDVVIYTCCLAAYDKRGQDILNKLIDILNKAGLEVGVFRDGSCCGDIVYHIGDDYFYEEIVNENVEKLENLKPSVVLTVSPHVYHNLVNLYPRYGGKISAKVMHHTQFLYEIINEGRLKPNKLDARLTYHDPCYLARYNGIVEEPRGIIEAIDGIDFVEMLHNKYETLCCGGGGGGIWTENMEARRATRDRLMEVAEADTDTMVTSCPYCIRMFEDEAKVMGSDIKVLDVIDVLHSSLG